MDESLKSAGAIGIIMALIELIKFIVTSFNSKKHKENEELIESKLNALLEWNSKVDSNGVPLGYFPRNQSDWDKQVDAKLEKLTYIQENLVHALEKIASLIDKISERQMTLPCQYQYPNQYKQES